MNLAIVKSGYFDGSGVSRVIESWARMLGAAGHRVRVVCRSGPKTRELSLPGVEMLLHPLGQERRDHLFVEAAVVGDLLEGLRRRGELDLVLPHSSILAAAIRRRLPDVSILQTIHSPSVDEHYLTNWKYAPGLMTRLKYPLTRTILKRQERLALESSTAVHTLSDYTWSLIRAAFPDVSRDVAWTRIPGTFDHESFVPPVDRARVRAELGLAADETVLFTVRRLVARNGVDRILTCAKTLRPDKTRFLIGGTGELSGELERRIAADGLGHLVQMLGFVTDEQLIKYYQAADVFLLPTRELECFGLPVIEAMACGCPPLVMPHGGPAEVCRDFPDYIAEANTDGAFTELVRRFLAGEIPRRIEGAERWVRERYAEEAVRPAVLDLVQQVTAEARSETG